MCRGLAIGYDVEKYEIICKGLSSHSETLGDREDYCVKLEVIIDESQDCGYTIELDEQSPITKGWVTKARCMSKRLARVIESWENDNQLVIWKGLANCQSYARREYANNSCQKTGEETDNSCQKTGGDTFNSNQKTGENTFNSFQETSGYTDNSYQKTGGNTDNSCQKTGGEWYMGLIKLAKYPKTTELIKIVKNDWKLTIVEFASWVANNPDMAKQIMSEELVK